MDIHGREGPHAGRTIQAIYELAGEQLTICYQLGSGERPTEFKSARGSQVLLVRYQRVQSTRRLSAAATFKAMRGADFPIREGKANVGEGCTHDPRA